MSVISEMRTLLTEAASDPVIIVVAWTNEVQELVPNQKAWRHDLGERPKLRDAVEARSAIWLNQGTKEDVKKAEAFVAKQYPETDKVFVYPVTEKDPLERARKDILKKRKPR